MIKRDRGRPITSPMYDMEIGDTISFYAPDAKETKRLHKNVSQNAIRWDKGFRGRMNYQTRVITFTRVR